MKRPALIVSLILGITPLIFAQSALEGTSFQASTYNLREENVGIVRLIDVAGSDCRVEDGPAGNDVPDPEACMTLDTGAPAVEVTFGAGPQPVGDILVEASATVFEGLETPIDITNFITQETATTTSFVEPGELLEFTMYVPERDIFPTFEDEDYWGFSATGIQYPNAVADSEVGLPFDEEIGNFTNFYFWYEGKDGPITEGYEVGLPVGLGVGRHPTDANREVLYPLYSRGQGDEQVDTPPGGSLDFYSHGSILDSAPQVGNLLFLADNTVNVDLIDPLEDVVGWGLAFLVHPPELDEPEVEDPACNPNTMGDLDGDGSVAFTDFLVLSANFGNPASSHAEGDIDCSGDVQFADFLILSANFGQSVGAAAVPEPSSSFILSLGLLSLVVLRNRNRV